LFFYEAYIFAIYLATKLTYCVQVRWSSATIPNNFVHVTLLIDTPSNASRFVCH